MIAIILTLLFILAVKVEHWETVKILSPFIIGAIIITVIVFIDTWRDCNKRMKR